MSRGLVVSNASPLIALAQIQHLDLLDRLFSRVVIPRAVAEEVTPTIPQIPAWIETRPLGQPIGSRILASSLGRGESEAISLGLELGADRVLLDERAARRLAQGLDLAVLGTLGLLSAAKRRGWIEALKPQLDALLHHDFRLAPSLYERVLQDVGELPPTED